MCTSTTPIESVLVRRLGIRFIGARHFTAAEAKLNLGMIHGYPNEEQGAQIEAEPVIRLFHMRSKGERNFLRDVHADFEAVKESYDGSFLDEGELLRSSSLASSSCTTYSSRDNSFVGLVESCSPDLKIAKGHHRRSPSGGKFVAKLAEDVASFFSRSSGASDELMTMNGYDFIEKNIIAESFGARIFVHSSSSVDDNNTLRVPLGNEYWSNINCFYQRTHFF
jgi:hypothetical protein